MMSYILEMKDYLLDLTFSKKMDQERTRKN